MKRRTIAFRELLEGVLPVAKLPPPDRARVAAALRGGDLKELEALALELLDRLSSLGHLRLVEEVLQGDEKVRRYRDLTTGNTLTLRLPVTHEDEGIYKVPLPIRDWKGSASLEQIRTLFHLYDKLLTWDSKFLRGPSNVLKQVMETTRQIVACDRVSFWADPQADGAPGPVAEISSEPYDEELAREWVLSRGYLVVLPELPAQIDPEARTLDTRFRSLAMVPVGGSEQGVSGVLHAWSVRPFHFDEDRQGLLSLVSECATDLLHRSRILESLVFVDAGTQVYNRAYFNLQLENEIARAKRDKASMALAIADIDDFRAINSRYGYEAGNQVLSTLAQVLKTGLRPFDSVARWGGEEFALILVPPVTVEDAVAVCERLRRSVELSRIAVTGLSGESLTIHLSVSVGGAVFPQHGTTSASLWRSANAALIHAKKTGKNKVVFVSELPEESSS
jgi:diguanylate cyclase (GGDEF)-like protein